MLNKHYRRVTVDQGCEHLRREETIRLIGAGDGMDLNC